LRKLSGWRLPAAVFALIVAAWLVAMCVFIALPIFPFAYYKDLGFNWEVVDWVVHTVHSPLDAFDSISWSPWYGGPTLYLNSYLGDVPTILVAKLSGDSWLAVKIVEVGQTIVAAIGGAFMYWSFRRSVVWAVCFGVLYAAAPATVLLVRWNQDFGWIAALMPGAVAAGRMLIFRFGYRALPLAGFLGAAAGHLIAAQFLLFVSLPVYTIVAATAFSKADRRGFAVFFPLGLVTCVLAGAFMMLPTVFGHPLFSDAANHAELLSNGDFLGNFSETPAGVATLILREWTEIGAPDFNVGTALPWLFLPMAAIWVVALATLRANDGLGGSRRALLVVVPCAVLAMGVNVPGGFDLWHLFARVPIVNSIRTTDRFLSIVPLFVLLWFVQGLDRRGRDLRTPARGSAWAAALVLCVFLAFDYSQRSFTVDNSKGEHEPQLNAVRQAVLSAGGRTTALVGIRDGSVDDAAVYGRPAPILAYTDTDLAGRFLTDGAGGAGMFERGGIHTVVVGPSWTRDAPYNPSSANVFRLVPIAHPIFTSPEDVSVVELPAKPALTAATAACVEGGPGPFDRLFLVPALRDVSLIDASPCSYSAFVDFDSRDAWKSLSPEDHWSATQLRAGGKQVRDFDYHPVLNRTMLNIPWYRNSVEGERPVFDDAGAVLVSDGGSVRLEPHAAWAAGSTVEVRVVALTAGALTLSVGQEPAIERSVPAARGFRWYSFVLPHAIAAGVPVTLAIEPQGVSEEDATARGLVVDGVAVLPPGARERYDAAAPTLFVARSLDGNGGDETPAETAEPTVFAPRGRIAPSSESGLKPVMVGATPELVATAKNAVVSFRWNGAPGVYDVAATANTYQDGASIVLGTGENTEASATRSGGMSGLSVGHALKLATGTPIVVRFETPEFKPQLGEAILDVRLRRHVELQAATPPAAATELDLTDPLDVAAVSLKGAVAMQPDGLHGSAGSHLIVPVRVAPGAMGIAAVAGADGGGTGSIGARCSAETSDAPITGPTASVSVVSTAEMDRCVVDIGWDGGNLAVKSLRVVGIGSRPTAQRVDTTLWIGAGSYDLSLVMPDGTVRTARGVTIATCKGAVNACSIARSGDYRVQFPVDDRGAVLLLMRHGFAAQSERTALTYRQTSAERWIVDLQRRDGIMLTELSDGNWTLEGSGRELSGRACNVIDTCFVDVPPGTYSVVHRWSGVLVLGITLTLAIIALSLGLLAPGLRAGLKMPARQPSGARVLAAERQSD